MIQINNISKSFKSKPLFNSLNLNIEKGKCTVLIGQSGCGKSTLLRLITGLLLADKGEILFDGITINKKNIQNLRQRMGYVIQEGGLFPHLTAFQNITLMASQLKWEKSRIQNKVEELCQLTHLSEDVLTRHPEELSGGQRQRLSLMRALILDPDLLLLDEPLGSLDPMIRASLQDELKEIFQKLKKTVIFVTHDMNEAGFLGDTIVLLSSGKIIQMGTIQNLLQQPKNSFVREFIESRTSRINLV